MSADQQPLVLNFDEHNDNNNAPQAAPIGGPIFIGDVNAHAIPMGKMIGGAPMALPHDVAGGGIQLAVGNAPVEVIGKFSVIFLNNAEAGDDDVQMS